MPESDLDLLLRAAKEAGEIALSHFGADPKIWEKDDNAGPVTEADLAVNAHLQSALTSAHPDFGWLSEETEDGSERLAKDKLFIVDPIDGTRAFIDRSENWAHSLAIVENGTPTAGVVEMPQKGLTFWATKGGGAFLNGKPIKVAPVDRIKDATVLTAKPNLRPEFWIGGKAPPFNTSFRSSLAYRLCAVASGRFDAMITLRPTWEWDVAAGTLIVEEAGGQAFDQTGSALIYNNPQPKLSGVLAGGPVVPKLVSQLV